VSWLTAEVGRSPSQVQGWWVQSAQGYGCCGSDRGSRRSRGMFQVAAGLARMEMPSNGRNWCIVSSFELIMNTI